MPFQQLSRKRDITLVRSEYPLLEGIKAYSEMVKREGEISKALAEYRSKIGELLDIIAGWQWNDPVSKIYRDLFKGRSIVDPSFSREDLLIELKYRQDHRIPPGFKDASNEYSGVGDLLIWKTILHLGEQESKHLIFVSGDEKADWRYQSESQALYPRFELLDEYRRASHGKSLLIISFAQLLEELGAPAPVVAEVKQEEAAASRASTSVEEVVRRRGEVEQAVIRWLLVQAPHGTAVKRQVQGPLLLHSAAGVEAYQIRYLRQSAFSFFISPLRFSTESLARYSETEHLPAHLVIVIDESNANEALIQKISRRIQITSTAALLSSITIGIITPDGRFEPRTRLNLKNV